MHRGGPDRVIKLYQPWPAPAQAACFSDMTVLPEIARWVATLRDDGRVTPDTHFTIERRNSATIGVLHTPTGSTDLLPGHFLTFTPTGLETLTPTAFYARYQPPG